MREKQRSMSLVIAIFSRVLLANTLKELPPYLLKIKQAEVSPKPSKKPLCLSSVCTGPCTPAMSNGNN